MSYPNSPTESRLSSSRDLHCIHMYNRSLEVQWKNRPMFHYIEKKQLEINSDMRAFLVDWLAKVAAKFNQFTETLYHAVSYIDRFLSKRNITKNRLQLLGVSSMIIASEQAELATESVEEFCALTDDTCTPQEVKQMMEDIQKVLDYKKDLPTIITFLVVYVKADQGDGIPDYQLKYLADYIAELSLLDYGCLLFLPSLIASSAVFLAKLTINPNIHPWTPKLQEMTGYRPSQLIKCVQALHDLQLKKKLANLNTIREKYSRVVYMGVSALVPPSEVPKSFFSDGSDDSSNGEC